MSEQPRQGPREHEADERISRLYHSLADERAPESLDQSILERASVRPARAFRWATPLALAATLALAVAVVLDTGRQARSPLETPGGDGPGERGILLEPGDARSSEAASPLPETRSLGFEAQEAASSFGIGNGIASQALGRAGRVPVSVHCVGESETPADWRACIQALEAAGRNEDAAAERDALAVRFPDALSDGD